MDQQQLQLLVLYGLAILVAITFHEFAHARVALALGDTTAARQGRVTLNPLSHLDPIGTIAILFTALAGVGIGWGRPVPVDRSAFRHPRGDFLVSAAGPGMNFLIALLAGLALRLLPLGLLQRAGAGGEFLLSFLIVLVQLNLALGLFNLIPLHPLDGSHALANLLPIDKAYRFEAFNKAHGVQILFGLLMLGWFTGFSPIGIVIGWPMRHLSHWLVGF